MGKGVRNVMQWTDPIGKMVVEKFAPLTDTPEAAPLPDPVSTPTPLTPQEEDTSDLAAEEEAAAARKRRGVGAGGTILTSPLGVGGMNVKRRSLLG